MSSLTTPSQSALATKADNELNQESIDYLRADAIVQAINANMPRGARHLKPIKTDVIFKRRDREIVQHALHAAFQLVGGVPALVRFAEDNPKEFYGIWSRMLPTNSDGPAGGTNIIFQSAIPQSPLDSVAIRPNGEVYVAEATNFRPPQDDDEELPE